MPKGDADNLRADLDDGYAKVSNLLLEMLACAPLTATEMRVVLFIMRRTYGWARGADRNTGRMDVMTAEDIATGIGKPVSTVEKALWALVKQRVLLQRLMEQRPGAKCAYGVNVEMSEWGDNRDWAEARTAHREAYENGAYSCRNPQPTVAENGNSQLPKSATETRKQLPKAATETGNEPNGDRGKSSPTDITYTDSSTDIFTDFRARGFSLYCQARHGEEDDPALGMEYDNVCAAYGEEATFIAAGIVSATFAGNGNGREKPRGGSVASYLMQTARTQAEKIREQGGDALLARFIAEHGPQKEDPTQAHIWELELAKFREQHVQPA